MYITVFILSIFVSTLILFCTGDSTILYIYDTTEKIFVYFKDFDFGAFLKIIFTKCTYFYNHKEVIVFLKDIKPFIDVFAGLAAIMGIIIPLIALFRSKRPAIRITSIKIFENQSAGKCSFAFTFSNCKSYPVSMHGINIYNKQIYLISESTSHSISFSGPGFSDSHKVYTRKLKNIIPASGTLSIILGGCDFFQHGELFVHLHTSDGYQTLKCKKVEFIKTGEAEVYDNMYDINDFFKAKLIYYGLRFPWKYTKSLAKKYAEKYSFGNDTE